MFAKVIAIVLAFTVFTSGAIASVEDGLKAAFDEFNYAITVEWDQKDPSFFEAKKGELISDILELQAAGLTNDELISFAKSQLKDAGLVRDMEHVMKTISINSMSPQEAHDYIIHSMSNSYAQGSSWHGKTDGAIWVLFAFPVILLIAAMASKGFVWGTN